MLASSVAPPPPEASRKEVSAGAPTAHPPPRPRRSPLKRCRAGSPLASSPAEQQVRKPRPENLTRLRPRPGPSGKPLLVGPPRGSCTVPATQAPAFACQKPPRSTWDAPGSAQATPAQGSPLSQGHHPHLVAQAWALASPSTPASHLEGRRGPASPSSHSSSTSRDPTATAGRSGHSRWLCLCQPLCTGARRSPPGGGAWAASPPHDLSSVPMAGDASVTRPAPSPWTPGTPLASVQ